MDAWTSIQTPIAHPGPLGEGTPDVTRNSAAKDAAEAWSRPVLADNNPVIHATREPVQRPPDPWEVARAEQKLNNRLANADLALAPHPRQPGTQVVRRDSGEVLTTVPDARFAAFMRGVEEGGGALLDRRV
jgi:hypothetical protein